MLSKERVLALRTQVWKKVLVRKYPRLLLRRKSTKLRERERKKLQQIATLKKIVLPWINSIPRG
jgi:hypothetical protein